MEQAATYMEPGEYDILPMHSINGLPTEILTHVFTSLSLKDRNNVRRVCKLWYECASCVSIMKEEKFVFRSNSSELDVVRILQSNFLRPNLEFQGLTLNTSHFPLYFWEKYGSKIRSLDFYCCQWNSSVSKKIIIHCINLRSLTIKNQSFNKKSYMSLLTPLNKCIKMGVKHTQLDALTVSFYANDSKFYEELLGKFLLVYPCIKYFQLGESRCWPANNKVYCSINEHLMDKIEYLTNLRIDLWCQNHVSSFKTVAKLVHKFRLEEFKIELTCKPFMEEAILNFFTEHSNIETVYITLNNVEDNFGKKLLWRCLENGPGIRYFSLDCCYSSVYIASEEFTSLIILIKNLQFLNVKICTNVDQELCFNNIILPPLPTTANLSLTSLGINNSLIAIRILQHCPLLKHLYLASPCNVSLQIIFQNLLNLQSLVLNNLAMCTNDGFLGLGSFQEGGYSISRLQELKFLYLSNYCGYNTRDIDDLNLRPFTLESILFELQCSHLEYLSLEIRKHQLTSAEAIAQLTSNIPAVTSLVLVASYAYNPRCTFYKIVLEFCKHLKNLHYLDIRCTSKNSRKTHDLSIELFEACPSLRYIKFSYNYSHNGEVFSFDPFTKKVVKLETESFKFRKNYFGNLEFCNSQIRCFDDF